MRRSLARLIAQTAPYVDPHDSSWFVDGEMPNLMGHRDAMQYRPADATECPGDALYARCAEVLDAARAAGVRYVDVARSYGRAEEFLARWLAERGAPVDALSVGSKWGYRYTAGWTVDAPVHEQKEHSVERFRAQLAESRALVGDRLDLYQVHSATALVVERPLPGQALPRADALVTRTPGLVVGALAADCTPILLADPVARVVAATHA